MTSSAAADVIDLSQHPARADCTRTLSGHRPVSVTEMLRRLTGSPHLSERPDLYGEGGALALLEARVAELLGTEAAMFVIKGTVAQQAVLRTYADRAGTSRVVVHPLSHLEYDEDHAYEHLHNIEPIRLGQLQPFDREDLEHVSGRLACVAVELPLRRAGYRLPPWDDLIGISSWCKERDVPLHLDGARLWESAASYDRPLAEVAALAGTTYVSFYKGLGGLGGCALAGAQDVLDEAKVWCGRHGANLFTAFPYVLSALHGLDHHLPAMPRYVARARDVAHALDEADGLRVAPNPPHTNAFQVFLDRDASTVADNALALADAESLWTVSSIRTEARPSTSMVEVVVGDALDDISDDEVVVAFRRLLD